MSDLERFIQWVNGLRGISQEQKRALKQFARDAATGDERFGARDRDSIKAFYESTTGSSWADAGYSWSGSNPGSGNTGGGGNQGGGNQGGGNRPPQPGSAWIWSPSQSRWVRPPRPNLPPGANPADLIWDDNAGWQYQPSDPTEPGTPTGSPGAAWIWDETAQKWVKPPQPTDGQTYTWDDEKGWVVSDPGDDPDDGREQRESASAFFRGLLEQYGFSAGDIDGLMGMFDEWIAEGFDNEAIMMKFRGTDIYARRFPGMAALSQRGQAISEGEYIRLESAYRGVLSSYGLPSEFFDSPDDYGQFIANNVSPDEVEERASTGMRILQSADGRILGELQEYYGVTAGTALAYLLDPNKAQDLIRRQVRAATIGGSAERYGFNMGRGFSENLAGTSLGQTIDGMNPQSAAQLDQSFITARRQADRERVLAAIDTERFEDTDAIQAMFGDEAKQLASQRRARRERARFMGSSGVGSSSLSVDRNL